MSFFNRFFARKRQPTKEQARLLSRISNPQQRRNLLRAIEEGEEIPSYAWAPLTEQQLGDLTGVVNNLQEKLADVRRRCQEEGAILEALVEFDPEGAANATTNPDLLRELIARMRAANGKTLVGSQRSSPAPVVVASCASLPPCRPSSATVPAPPKWTSATLLQTRRRTLRARASAERQLSSTRRTFFAPTSSTYDDSANTAR
jgi:hypothetical protein